VGDGAGSNDQSLGTGTAKSLAALEAAESVLDNAMSDAAPAWFDYYDRPRLAGFKGQVHIRLAQPEIAHAVLDEAIGALDPDAAKQRACYLADQATVCVDQGEVDKACQLGIQATPAPWSGRVRDRRPASPRPPHQAKALARSSGRRRPDRAAAVGVVASLA